MDLPEQEIERILKLVRNGCITESEAFWQIVYWAGSDAVTDEHVHALPKYWRQKLVHELASIRIAHPNYLRQGFCGEWTEAAMRQACARRDQAFLRLAALLDEPNESN